MTLEAGDDHVDLGRVGDDGDDRHAGTASGAGHNVQLVDLGQQPSRCQKARALCLFARGYPGLLTGCR